jgi:hypothetical protein
LFLAEISASINRDYCADCPPRYVLITAPNAFSPYHIQNYYYLSQVDPENAARVRVDGEGKTQHEQAKTQLYAHEMVHPDHRAW